VKFKVPVKSDKNTNTLHEDQYTLYRVFNLKVDRILI